MSEMLGNQYFIARNYSAAETELEKCLETMPGSKSLKRKLIICFTQTGKISRALEMFTELIREDIEFVINADEIKDDCPCSEIVETIEQKNSKKEIELDDRILLGILWLYCNTEKSLFYFEEVNRRVPGIDNIQICIRLITNYIKTQKSNTEIRI